MNSDDATDEEASRRLAPYRGRDVLVLGGLGFIGSALARALLDLGAIVTVLARPRAKPAPLSGYLRSRGAALVEADVHDFLALEAAAKGKAAVFHLAGRSGAVDSVRDPLADLRANCGGALTVLEALRSSAPACKLVFAASRLIYGAPDGGPVGEDHPLEPTCPYGVHNATVERYLHVYAHLHGIRSTSLRITNVYGPGQPAERCAYGIINYFIHVALRNGSIPVFGAGVQLRDFIYVDDVVHAMLLAGIDDGSDGMAINIGSGYGVSMIDAARLIVQFAGSGNVENRPWPTLAQQIDGRSFVADIRRAHKVLGWRPCTTFATGLSRTISLHRKVA